MNVLDTQKTVPDFRSEIMLKSVPMNPYFTAENHVTSKQHWRILLKKTVDSGKSFFDISVNTGQICMGFESYTRVSQK